MATNGACFEEEIGGPRTPENLIAFPQDGIVHTATKVIWKWAPCGAYAPQYVRVPSWLVEGLFAQCCVPVPEELTDLCFLTQCLDVKRFISDALEVLIDKGLFKNPDSSEDDDSDIVFEENDAIYLRARELILQHFDNEALQIRKTSFEWLEGHTPGAPRASEIDWLHSVSLRDLTARTGNLYAYVALMRIVGPRSTERTRLTPGETFYVVVAGQTGGQLGTAMRTHYFDARAGEASDLPASFLAAKLPDFLIETAWPFAYDVCFEEQISFAFDLPKRATWKKMTRLEWVSAVQARLPATLRGHCPKLYALFEDWLDSPGALVAAVQTIGDLILPGDDVDKLPLARIDEVETGLADALGDLIDTECEQGESTQAIYKKVRERLQEKRQHEKRETSASGPSDSSDDTMRGPKPGQIQRGQVHPSFVRLESKWRPKLEAGNMPVEDSLQFIAECFEATSVLPKAALLASKGTRASLYVGSNGTEFLALVASKRELMPLYLARSVAFDDETGEVPKELMDVELDDVTTRYACDFEIWSIDVLNKVALMLRGEEAGTTFAMHNTKSLFNTIEGMLLVKEYLGKLVSSLGWPDKVTAEEGWTFKQLMSELLKILKHVMALPAEQQKRGFALIDDFAAKAIRQGALAGKKIVYGLLPAEEFLRAFLKADTKEYRQIKQCGTSIKESAAFMRDTGGIFTAKPQAATVATFGVAGSSQTPPIKPNPRKPTKGPKKTGAGTPAKVGAPTPKGPKKARKEPYRGATIGTFPSGSGNALQMELALWPYDDGTFSLGARRERANREPNGRMSTDKKEAPPIRDHRTEREGNA